MRTDRQTAKSTRRQGSHLKKSLGFFAMSFYAIGMIIGAGIYSVIGKSAGEAGSQLWLSFLISSFLAMLTGFSYAELATRYPKAGGEYAYAKEMFPKLNWFAFFIGAVLIVMSATTVATVALAFAEYFRNFFEWNAQLVAAIVICSLVAVNALGMSFSTKFNIAFTTIEILGLVAVMIAASHFKSDAFFAFPEMSFHPGVLSAAALLFFVYLGFEDIANLAEEAKDPHKNIPRVIVLSLIVTTLLYIGVAWSITKLVSPAELSASGSPLVAAVRPYSENLSKALGAVALFSTANTVLIGLLSMSRRVYGMAEGGHLPRKFSKVKGTHHTPIAAVILSGLLSLAFVSISNLKHVASLASFFALLGFTFVNVGVVVDRRRLAKVASNTFRVPLNVKNIPIPAVLAACSCIGFLFYFEKIVYLLAVGTLALLSGFYWLFVSLLDRKVRRSR